MNKTIWRSFTTSLDSLIPTNEYEEIQKILNFLTQELNSIIHDPHQWKQVLKYAHLSRGDFWNTHNRITKSPHKHWPREVGERAKYYRSLQEQLRVLAVSQEHRRAVEHISRKHDWTMNQAIRNELTQNNLYPTNYDLQNICKSKKTPSIPRHLNAVIDFTVQDKQTVKTLNTLTFAIKIKRNWIVINIPKPKYLHANILKYSKPKIRVDKRTQKLMVDISYSIPIQETSPHRNAILGVDKGFLKHFSASAVTSQGDYTPELLPSRELDQLDHKITVLNQEIQRVTERVLRLEKYLVNQLNTKTQISWESAQSQLIILKDKRTRIKKHATRIAARDIVTHSLNHHAHTIHMEDLRFASNKNTHWDFSRIDEYVTETAQPYSIDVVKVNAAYTSSTDPWTRKTTKQKAKRKVTTVAGDLDRDRTASLEIAQRQPRKSKKTYSTQHKLRSQGPLNQTKRAKPLTRTGMRKAILVKRIGTRPIVAPPTVTKAITTTGDQTPPQPIIDHTKVLQC